MKIVELEDLKPSCCLGMCSCRRCIMKPSCQRQKHYSEREEEKDEHRHSAAARGHLLLCSRSILCGYLYLRVCVCAGSASRSGRIPRGLGRVYISASRGGAGAAQWPVGERDGGVGTKATPRRVAAARGSRSSLPRARVRRQSSR